MTPAAGRAARFVAYAARYAELGWALIPLDGKKPKPVDWEKTRPDAPDLAAGKWSHWGERQNMGVVLGAGSLAVVEYDTAGAEATLRELLDGRQPRTPTARTGSGRLHLYFRDPGVAKAARDGLEIRTGSHQCVVPPSVHPDTGVEYEWLEGLEPWTVALAEVPEAVLAYFAEARPNGHAAPVGTRIPERNRNVELTSIAGTMRRRGLGETEIAAALLETNRARCKPPLPEDEVRGIAKSVARYQPETSRPRGSGPPAASIETPAERQHSWRPLDLVELGARPPQPPTLGGILYPGQRHVISGEPEAMKSWAVLVICAEQIQAGNTVVYIDFEMGPSQMLERLRQLGVTDDEISSRFVYLQPEEPLTDPLVRADVEQLVAERKPTLVVVDAFTGALLRHGLKEESGLDIEQLYLTLDFLRAHGAGLVILDHLAKDEKRGMYAIGSQRKIGGVDVHLGFEVIAPFGRGRTGRAKIVTHKDRPAHLPRPKAGELTLTSDAETGAITWGFTIAAKESEQPPFRPTHLMQLVSEYLDRQAAPVSKTMITAAVGKRKQYVIQAIQALLDEGYATVAPGGGIVSKRPFRDPSGPVPEGPENR